MWHITGGGRGDDSLPVRLRAISPSMNLKSTVYITGGTGTKQDPFTISQ